MMLQHLGDLNYYRLDTDESRLFWEENKDIRRYLNAFQGYNPYTEILLDQRNEQVWFRLKDAFEVRLRIVKLYRWFDLDYDITVKKIEKVAVISKDGIKEDVIEE